MGLAARGLHAGTILIGGRVRREVAEIEHGAMARGRPNARPALVCQTSLVIYERARRFGVSAAVAVDVVVGVAQHYTAWSILPCDAISSNR
jgi:hypothetical protein